MCLSVCPSGLNISAPTGSSFIKFYVWGLLENQLRNFQISWKSKKNSGCLTQIRIHIMITFRWIVPTMINITDEDCREKAHIFGYIQNSCQLWDNVEKYGRARKVTDKNIIRRMRVAGYIPKAAEKPSEYVIIIALHSTNGTRTRVNMALCMHCLSWYRVSPWRALRIAVDFSVCIHPFLCECTLCVQMDGRDRLLAYCWVLL